mgnify:CR=1 FL=1
MQTIKVANAPCSWGILEFGLQGEGVAATQVLQEMSAAGFEGTELGDWGFLPTNPLVLTEVLERYGLSLVGAFVPVNLVDADTHKAGVEAAVRTADLLARTSSGAKLVLADDNGKDPERTRLAGRIGSEQALDADQWQVFTQGVERIARSVKEQTGVSTVFHHHCAGFVETPSEVDFLLENTSPDLLGLCLDTGHFMYGGGEPMEALKAYGDRVWHIHFKDCDHLISRPVVFQNRGFGMTPMEQGLRVVGTVEFGGLKNPLSKSRIKNLVNNAKFLLDGLPEEHEDEWLGFRPTLPDYLPVIGPSKNYKNVFYSFGHHHLGWTLGAISGKIISKMIADENTNLNLEPYSSRRFS